VSPGSRPGVGAALVCALLAGCALDNQLRDADAGIVTIGDLSFRIASGTARVEGATLGLYLTDQPDACLAISHVPVGRWTVLTLRVAPRADGATEATVVSVRPVPAPGEAAGGLTAQIGGETTARLDATEGSVVWKANADGTTTIVALDVGFGATSDRLVATDLTVPACR
jgi:hypothetical protein